jgi:uncharacterized oxidoreductase
MRFQSDKLISLVHDLFETAGCSADEAERIATLLVEANLVGHDSHGVVRVPSYLQWLREGKVIANQSVRVVHDHEAIVVLDGQFGFGQSIGEQAVRIGLEKSARYGVSVVALRNSGHLGRIGDWALMAADAGNVSLHFVNTSGAGMLVSPFGGVDRRLSACPIAMCAPIQGAEPMLVDMAACTIAEGKIRVALYGDKDVPDNCLVDADGNPTNDPKVFYGDPPGSILPIAGHKGYALLMAAELLSGALTGGSCTDPANAGRVANGMLSIFMDPSLFGSQEAFEKEAARFISFVKTSRTVGDDGQVLAPGDIERRTKARRLEEGIELDDSLWAEIFAVGEKLGVQHDHPAPSQPAGRPGGRQADGLYLPGIDPVPGAEGDR